MDDKLAQVTRDQLNYCIDRGILEDEDLVAINQILVERLNQTEGESIDPLTNRKDDNNE